jgi:hypothetical protein
MRKNMMKKIIQKKLVATCLIAIFTISLLPLAQANIQHTDDTTILILNNTHRSLEKNQITLSPETTNTLIQELLKNQITPSNYKQEMRKKLILFRDAGLISSETADTITYKLNTIPTIFSHPNPLAKQGIFFDISNIFSGTFFGIQGVKDLTYLNLTLYDFPFFAGKINAGFYGMNRFTGNGTVFTVGFLGFKYLYDYNETKYKFPYFPEIRGTVLGYSGLFIYIDSFNYSGTQQGPFIIGIGMSIMTLWKNIKPATM